MDKETLRKQLYEEIQSQFEGKLREAKRDRQAVEEEMEVASEKWRTERRRLNAEIDRLEAKLTEARDRKKAPDSRSSRGADAQELAKVQAAADDKIARATEAFESDRQKLQAEITRLQANIADLIERSNNPLRTSQLEKEKFETRLEDAIKARKLADAALLEGKAGWEQEKLKLLAELAKLRTSSQDKVKAQQDAERVKQLEKQVEELLRSRDSLVAELEKARLQLKANQVLSEELDALNLQVERSKKERANVESQLQELSKLKAQAEQVPALTSQIKETHNEIAELQKQLQEASRYKAQTEQLADLTAQVEKSQKERANLERQLREASKLQEKAERELDKVRQSPIIAREAQSAEIERLKEELKNARLEVRNQAGLMDEMRSASTKERAALEKQIREASAQQEKLARDLDRLQNARGGKESESAEVARLQQELEKAGAQARLAAATSREEHAAELERLTQQLNDARMKLRDMEAAVRDAQQSANTDALEKLRAEYDQRIEDLNRQKSELAGELSNTGAMLEEERLKLAAREVSKTPATNGNGVNHELIDGEVERVQEMLAGIARIIEDPETELSTVIRKNVERAELDAYLKGILFSMGRGRGL